MEKIKILKGNIVNVEAEAIVNPASNDLMPGLGVNKTIFYTAGDRLVNYCSEIGHCDDGKAVLTPAFNGSMEYIIHTVGPYWFGGYESEAKTLASCYISCLKIAKENNINSIAFPAISTGYGRYPAKEAAEIALATVKSFLVSNNLDIEVNFMCADDESLLLYRKTNANNSVDIMPYLKRREIKVNKKFDKDEQKLMKKKIFQKEITEEQKKKAFVSVFKRVLKKHPDLIAVSAKIEPSEINEEFCKKYDGKYGPYVNLKAVTDLEYKEDGVSFTIKPFCYKPVVEEVVEEAANNSGMNVSSYVEDVVSTFNIEEVLEEIIEEESK